MYKCEAFLSVYTDVTSPGTSERISINFDLSVYSKRCRVNLLLVYIGPL